MPVEVDGGDEGEDPRGDNRQMSPAGV